MIINEAGGGVGGVDVGVGVGPVGVGEVGVGVEDGIVSLEPNDDFAMGAPPGAPGAIGEGVTPRGLNLEGVGRRRNRTVSGATTAATATTGTTGDAPDATPRAAVIGLPMMVGNNATIRGGQQQGHQRHATIRARPALESPTPRSCHTYCHHSCHLAHHSNLPNTHIQRGYHLRSSTGLALL